MTLLQRYIFRQALWPLVVALVGLAGLALLTQSLSTLELIVKNRQSAGTFFWITLLALPQLISIILPMAMLLSSLFALNRLNSDSELVVARATGIGPWQIANPVLRLAILAAILHLLVNLFVQPAAFREMRSAILDVRTDIASKMVLPGEFARPVKELTVYGQDIQPGGLIRNLVIHDSRDDGPPTTYVAEEGFIVRSGSFAQLTLRRGSIQKRVAPDALDFIAFQQHQIDLTDIVAEDTVLRLKKSDRFLHELVFPAPADLQRADELSAEAHNRLASTLYAPAFALLALVFLATGRHQRMGYGGKIVACAALGFVLRLVGFSLASAAESDRALNLAQYAVPGLTILGCLALLTLRKRIRIATETLSVDAA